MVNPYENPKTRIVSNKDLSGIRSLIESGDPQSKQFRLGKLEEVVNKLPDDKEFSKRWVELATLHGVSDYDALSSFFFIEAAEEFYQGFQDDDVKPHLEEVLDLSESLIENELLRYEFLRNFLVSVPKVIKEYYTNGVGEHFSHLLLRMPDMLKKVEGKHVHDKAVKLFSNSPKFVKYFVDNNMDDLVDPWINLNMNIYRHGLKGSMEFIENGVGILENLYGNQSKSKYVRKIVELGEKISEYDPISAYLFLRSAPESVEKFVEFGLEDELNSIFQIIEADFRSVDQRLNKGETKESSIASASIFYRGKETLERYEELNILKCFKDVLSFAEKTSRISFKEAAIQVNSSSVPKNVKFLVDNRSWWNAEKWIDMSLEMYETHPSTISYQFLNFEMLTSLIKKETLREKIPEFIRIVGKIFRYSQTYGFDFFDEELKKFKDSYGKISRKNHKKMIEYMDSIYQRSYVAGRCFQFRSGDLYQALKQKRRLRYLDEILIDGETLTIRHEEKGVEYFATIPAIISISKKKNVKKNSNLWSKFLSAVDPYDDELMEELRGVNNSTIHAMYLMEETGILQDFLNDLARYSKKSPIKTVQYLRSFDVLPSLLKDYKKAEMKLNLVKEQVELKPCYAWM